MPQAWLLKIQIETVKMNQKLKTIIPWLFAGFLVAYHCTKIYVTVTEQELEFSYQLIWITCLRTMIVLSFIALVFKPKLGLGMMWLFIGSLVTTQIYMQWSTDLGSVFALLKGLIIPSLITWLMQSNKPASSS